jgi:hypothetical protein
LQTSRNPRGTGYGEAKRSTDPDTSSKVSDEVLDLFRDKDFDEDSCKRVCKNLGVITADDLCLVEDEDIKSTLDIKPIQIKKLKMLVNECKQRSAAARSPSNPVVSHGGCSSVDSMKAKAGVKTMFGKGPRVALCIGIDDYPGNQRLSNCVADARDMRDCCEYRLGFDIAKVLTNPKRADILQALKEFREYIKDGSLVVFFFSGHGAEHEGVNYLLPLGMEESTSAEDYEDHAVPLDSILKKLRKGTNAECNIVNVILLDCCRENSINETFKNTKGLGDEGTKGFGKSLEENGLRSTSSNAEFLIGLACDPGTAALANDGARNSRYTEALLRHLPEAGRQLEESMKAVSIDVFEKTLRKQRPWKNDCLHQSVVLVPRQIPNE